MAENHRSKDDPMLDFENYARILGELDFKPSCDCSYCELRDRYKSSKQRLNLAYAGELNSKELAMFAAPHMISIDRDNRFILSAISLRGDDMVKKWCRISQSRRKGMLTDAGL